ncbi:MAG TPA: peptidylprolyl isomerase [Chitinophagaceae bacterium]|nr:peptidylprolyl isomerase [Chitinophagaceae bacterium]
MKRVIAFSAALCLAFTANAQTLFSYGDVQVDANDFLKAYHKNNPEPQGDKATSIREYLDLYINSRLKIQEAYTRRYDTLPAFLDEVRTLRSQIVENYMNDPLVTDQLVREAFTRSQKDIHAAHIFISARNQSGVVDTAAALKRVGDILKQLGGGANFLQVAQSASDDPSAGKNRGDLGWVTVFTLPYEFENIIYATPAGKYSAPYRSRLGYHIFYNLGERKAAGRMKAQQILLAIPPDASDAVKTQIAKTADSIHKRIQKGESFEKLAASLSNDYITAASNGNMPEIRVGQYDPEFEKQLWALAKDGAVSKPFQTSHGWHIVKRVALRPIVTDSDDKENLEDLKQKIMADGRWKAARGFIYDKVRKDPGLQHRPVDAAALRAYSDSLLEYKPLGIGKQINNETILFIIGQSKYTAADWISYAQAFRFKSDGSGAKPHEQVMEEFVNQSLYNYYRDHLEDYNSEFREQMQEFRDGNLFFEIMQREVWQPAQSDSTALIRLYEQNRSKYLWKQSADVVAFFCSDQSHVNSLQAEIRKNPQEWRKIAQDHAEHLAADSSRYEWEQIPGLTKFPPKEGMLTTPVKNELDNTAAFAYIVKVYPQPTQRSFAEARGMAINDYQEMLEAKWLEQLKQKYPVRINEQVLASILK